MCETNFEVDPVTCTCAPLNWMECEPGYKPTLDCNQWETDAMKGRDPRLNPFSDEDWYKTSVVSTPLCGSACLEIDFTPEIEQE